ncbi:hypothetical protein DPMN_150974 [Dreissena polymorpha]|uniref:Uncharacterized protein n=1 Tax=Dreissena polymorpha TaxID=45954 RepID=A0A9D4FE89_DREPO|nr:hypothetical protein DPMN_150974 [Dreissena polymorpha]
MADVIFLFNRVLSFIEPQNVVAPKIDVAHYQEGDLIKATYQKQTYDAVISEIHHDEVSLKASKATA